MSLGHALAVLFFAWAMFGNGGGIAVFFGICILFIAASNGDK